MRHYYINSNTGDYIKYDDRFNEYELHIIAIYLPDSKYLPGNTIIINERQFKHLKGFLPIKEKKLLNRLYRYTFDYYNTYCPTVKGGVKEKTKEQIKIPDNSDIRDEVIDKLFK